MGTNYYLKKKYKQPIHICKNSIGWVPLFEATEKVGSFAEIADMVILYDWHIEDEYGDKIDIEEFWELINRKYDDRENKHHFTCFDEEYGKSLYKDPLGLEFYRGEFR